jgi:hypothetical protein
MIEAQVDELGMDSIEVTDHELSDGRPDRQSILPRDRARVPDSVAGLRQDDGGARVRRIPYRDGAIYIGEPVGA